MQQTLPLLLQSQWLPSRQVLCRPSPWVMMQASLLPPAAPQPSPRPVTAAAYAQHSTSNHASTTTQQTVLTRSHCLMMRCWLSYYTYPLNTPPSPSPLPSESPSSFLWLSLSLSLSLSIKLTESISVPRTLSLSLSVSIPVPVPALSLSLSLPLSLSCPCAAVLCLPPAPYPLTSTAWAWRHCWSQKGISRFGPTT